MRRIGMDLSELSFVIYVTVVLYAVGFVPRGWSLVRRAVGRG